MSWECVHEAAVVGMQTATVAAEEVQTASIRFFLPVTVAYLTACASWLALDRLAFAPRRKGEFPRTRHPWLDLAMAILAAAAILALGSAYRNGWLLPSGPGVLRHLSWAANNLIIFSPIAAVLAIRGQGLDTVLVPVDRIGRRLIIGACLGVLAVSVFLILRGAVNQLDDVIVGIVNPDNATNFLPVMLEGVALAFLFVRFRWVMGAWPSLIVAGVLFAAAHIPRQMEDGRSLEEMAAFFFLNTLLPAAILATVVRSRDVLWLGIVHYIMDIAIRAFD